MPKYLDIGYLSGHALVMLEQLISTVYLPVLTNSDFRKMEAIDLNKAEGIVESQRKSEAMKAELEHEVGVNDKSEGIKNEFVISMFPQSFLKLDRIGD